MSTVMITGASSGIGRGFAEEYAAMGYKLILCGRNTKALRKLKEELAAVYQVKVRTISLDLTEKDSVKKLMEMTETVRVDCLINNAGFGVCGAFTNTDIEAELKMIRINDMAMHELMKRMLLKMEQQGHGTILNVASSAGLLPGGPYMAAYYASKAYMVSLTRGVCRELKERKSPVYICALCPGPVDTAFHERAGAAFALKSISVHQCVQAAMRGMRLHQTIIVPGRMLALGMKLQGLLPVPVLLALCGRQQKKKLCKR